MGVFDLFRKNRTCIPASSPAIDVPIDNDYQQSLTPDERDYLCGAVISLLDRIDTLRPYEEIDLSPPSEDDEVIYLPVEGTFNKRFFARLFLLRNHMISGQVVSLFDMIQYQIPVKASNEELILLVYGTHILDEILLPLSHKPIGTSLCEDTDDRIKQFCNTIGFTFSIWKIRDKAPWRKNAVLSSEEYKSFESALELLRQWISDNFQKAEAAFQSSEYNSIKWISEYRLYSNIKILHPDAIFQYSPHWLNGQSIDVFIPSLGIGIEYQGRQHYEPIDYFGGDEKLIDNARRDRTKVSRCEEHDIILYYWPYNQKIVFSAVARFLSKTKEDIEKQLLYGLPRPVTDVLIKAKTYAKVRNQEERETTQQHQTVIRRYTVEGLFLEEYASIKQAAEDSEVCLSSIQKCLSGQRKTAGGFVWNRELYQSPPLDEMVIQGRVIKSNEFENTGLSKPVFQIDPHTGEILARFDSIGKAARDVGIHSKGIKDVIDGKQRTAGGYSWQFASE